MKIYRTALLCSLVLGLQAYTPPVDTAGPLTVRILEPAVGNYGAGGLVDFSKPGAPATVEVMLENSGGEALSGTVRIQVIDRWKVEPAGAVPFSLDARGRGRLDFTVWFEEGTFNAHYPIHAIAEFRHQGQRLVAHPVLIFVAQVPNPPRARLPVEWRPLEVPPNGAIALWRIPLHRETTQVEEETLPGVTDREGYGTSVTSQFGDIVERGGARAVISMGLGPRPPSMRERVSMARVEYPLRLPKVQPIRLRFATAVSDGVREPGAVFRVRTLGYETPATAEGKIVFERQLAARRWTDADVDLSSLAGQAIRLQFEATGANDPVYWAEPTLLAGTPVTPAAFPPAESSAGRTLGKAGAYDVRVWPGKRGLLDSSVGFVNGSQRLLFHGFRVRIAGEALDDWRSNYALAEFREEPATGHYRVRHNLRGWAGPLELVGDLWVESAALRARFWLENVPAARPWLDVHIEALSSGPWNQAATRVYGGVGNVVVKPRAFQMSFDGHHFATSFVGFDFDNGVSLVQAVDVPPDRLAVDPAVKMYSLVTPHSQTLAFFPVNNVWEGVKLWREINGLRAAGGVNRLAGRFVFDLWGGRYGESAVALERAFRYGLTNAAVVWHRWQRWGYDYRLPDVYPPDPEFGTLPEFQRLAEVSKKAGVVFAPHDNYIDYYPDSEGFSYENIIFNPDGTPQRAWFNRGRLAQSYRARPDRVMQFVERNLALIKDSFAPTGYFIDVWSSRGPSDYWTQSGEFMPKLITRKAWGETFAWIRNYLGDQAPQISEAGHDALIGWLDGAQANHLRVEKTALNGFVLPVDCDDAERIPWFDAAHHDRFVLHGAGYPGRYEGGLDGRAHGIYSDDYIATEVLTGHPGMVPVPYGRDVVRKYWLLDGLMRSLALRRVETLTFDGDNIHRQRVRWDNAADIAVNRGHDEWSLGDHRLPEYGFYARSNHNSQPVEAAIERRDGVIVEWSRSPEAYYVNARPVVLDTEIVRARENAGPDPRPARMNPDNKMIAFPGISTNGGFRLTRDGDSLLLTPLPASPRFQARIRWNSLPWQLRDPAQAEALDENATALRRVDLRKEGGEVVLDGEPGVFQYRLR